MKTIGNIIWVVFGGLISAIVLIFEAVFWCVTIIGIPIGVKLFQLASFVIWPFGKKVTKVKPSGFKTVLNVIWAILFGWIDALLYCLIGLLYCITIIGIPFGRQYFKIAHFVLTPLGCGFVSKRAWRLLPVRPFLARSGLAFPLWIPIGTHRHAI